MPDTSTLHSDRACRGWHRDFEFFVVINREGCTGTLNQRFVLRMLGSFLTCNAEFCIEEAVKARRELGAIERNVSQVGVTNTGSLPLTSKE